MTKPIKFKLTQFERGDLVNGFRGDKVQFEHRPYEQRSPAAREAYDKLKTSLEAHGMLDPLITYQGHVLIGMRRFEIMGAMTGPRTSFPCYEIQEDVANWDREDVNRLNEFKAVIYSSERIAEFMG